MRSYIVSMLMLTSIVLYPQISLAKKVYSPHVEQGEIALETQTDLFLDPDPTKDGKVRQQFELEYGFFDWWKSGVYAVYEKPGNRSNYDYTATKWENIFVLPELSWFPVHWGLYGEYIWAAPSTNAADAVEGKLLVETELGDWKHTLNLTLKQSLASTAPSANFGYAWRSGIKVSGIGLALEAYGSVGPFDRFLPLASQSHLVGPVISFEPLEHVELEAGWLMDINAGPGYGDLKVNLEIEF